MECSAKSSGTIRLRANDVTALAALETAATDVDQPGVIEYWKSAPYLLNFMDEYKVKKEIVSALARRNAPARRQLVDASRLLLDWSRYESYERLDAQNARLRWLEEWLDATSAWKLLWLPPTLPYWNLGGAFATAAEADLTKRLVFSGWNVVPKAIASMMSYEVERRILRSFEEDPRNTPEARKRRRPLLRFQIDDGRPSGMPVLGWMYPSSSLVSLIDPAAAARCGRSDAEGVLREAENRIGPLLEPLFRRYATSQGSREDEAWYWAAPILLDLAESPADTRAWFEYRDLASFWAEGIEGEADVEADQGWAEHVAKALELVEGGAELGPPPADLATVLAKLAIGGAGVCAARALSRAGLGHAAPGSDAVRDAAAYVAWGFRTLFNQPEAMAIVRAGRGNLPYWRMVIDYSVEGCLQAVLDEFAHLSRDLQGLIDPSAKETVEGVGNAIVVALTLRTSTARADEFDLEAESAGALVRARRMRNHFALRFATQESEEGASGARIEHVRAAFNSPFWPFVLLTTAVGQEGLDFHAYCHAVVHWNLPSNPVDLEQREGRVHRYKGHAVRKNVAARYGASVLAESGVDIWERLFEVAAERDGQDGHGLVPFWVFPGAAAIERHVPAFPLSRESRQIEALKRSLAVYRMVFGQPRQDDLMAFLLSEFSGEELQRVASELQIDLSPRASTTVTASAVGLASP
jgi:hypothetical protein